MRTHAWHSWLFIAGGKGRSARSAVRLSLLMHQRISSANATCRTRTTCSVSKQNVGVGSASMARHETKVSATNAMKRMKQLMPLMKMLMHRLPGALCTRQGRTAPPSHERSAQRTPRRSRSPKPAPAASAPTATDSPARPRSSARNLRTQRRHTAPAPAPGLPVTVALQARVHSVQTNHSSGRPGSHAQVAFPRRRSRSPTTAPAARRSKATDEKKQLRVAGPPTRRPRPGSPVTGTAIGRALRLGTIGRAVRRPHPTLAIRGQPAAVVTRFQFRRPQPQLGSSGRAGWRPIPQLVITAIQAHLKAKKLFVGRPQPPRRAAHQRVQTFIGRMCASS